MEFGARLSVDRRAALAVLGYNGAAPDDATTHVLEEAARCVEEAAKPRYASTRFLIAWLPATAGGSAAGRPSIGGVALPGRDIAAHLAGCPAAVLLGVTLGAGVDAALRRAAAVDMRMAALLDASASALCEQYAGAAQDALREQAALRGEHLTGRYSPGYGDFGLAAQADIVRLLDLPRAIGVAAAQGGALSPQKSITAVLGAANVPVAGKLAGCATCNLRDKCDKTKCRFL